MAGDGRLARSVVAVLVTVALVAAAAGLRAEAGLPQSAPPTTEPVADGSIVDQLVVDLAAAGIEVYEHPGSEAPIIAATAPLSPVRLLRDQVARLVGDLGSGGGVPVETLDADIGALGVDDGADAETLTPTALTPSQLIVAWADHGDTAAAALARRALDTANTIGDSVASSVVVPQLVLILFAADVATVGAALPEPHESAGWASASRHHVDTPAIPPGPCSTAITFVNRVIADVFDAIGRLRNPPPIDTGFGLFDSLVNGLATVVVGGINVALDGAEFVIEGVTRVAIGTVLSYVGRVATIAATAAMIASAVRPWSLRLTPEPRTVEAPSGGVIHARIDLGGLDEWPAWAVDCARVASVTLPPLRPQGNPITWTPSAGLQALMTPTDVDRELREGGVAEFHYVVTAEPPQPGQPTVTDCPMISAVVQRDDLRQLGNEIQSLLQRELANLVPPVGELIAPHLAPLVRPWIDRALGLVEHLRDVRWRTWPCITHADPNPPPPTQPPAPPAAVGVLDVRCPSLAEIAAATGQNASEFYAPPANPEGITMGCVYLPDAVTVAFGVVAFWENYCPDGTREPASVPGATDAFFCRGADADSSLGVLVGDRVLATVAATDEGAIALARLLITTS